jgi:hypothetical protein
MLGAAAYNTKLLCYSSDDVVLQLQCQATDALHYCVRTCVQLLVGC